MEKVRPWCGQPSDRGRLRNRTVCDCRSFSDVSVSQGSVASQMRCGQIFNKYFVANLLQNLTVKFFFTYRLRINRVTAVTLMFLFFLQHGVVWGTKINLTWTNCRDVSTYSFYFCSALSGCGRNLLCFIISCSHPLSDKKWRTVNEYTHRCRESYAKQWKLLII